MKGKLKYIIPFMVLLVISVIEFILLIKPNKELTSVNNEEEIKLADAPVYFSSNNVHYDNSNGLTSSNVQDAIEELYGITVQRVTDLNTCNTDKQTAQNNYSTCSTNLSTCNGNLTIAQSTMVTYRDEVCPGCVYRKSSAQRYNSNASGADGTNNILSSSEYTTDYTTLNSNYFLGHVLDGSGNILASYACGINRGIFFCLRGVDSDQNVFTYRPFYQEGVNRMKKAFPDCNPTTYCNDELYARVNYNGDIEVRLTGTGRCIVDRTGFSLCS